MKWSAPSGPGGLTRDRAEVGLRQLDEEYATWREGVIALGENGLARPCGSAEGPFADYPMAALVLHIHREVLHHGAEIALLRDLFAHQPQREQAPGSTDDS